MTDYSNRFAKANASNDTNIFKWMCDRQVLPHSLGQAWLVKVFDTAVPEGSQSLRHFYDDYIEMTKFVWPKAWLNQVM